MSEAYHFLPEQLSTDAPAPRERLRLVRVAEQEGPEGAEAHIGKVIAMGQCAVAEARSEAVEVFAELSGRIIDTDLLNSAVDLSEAEQAGALRIGIADGEALAVNGQVIRLTEKQRFIFNVLMTVGRGQSLASAEIDAFGFMPPETTRDAVHSARRRALQGLRAMLELAAPEVPVLEFDTTNSKRVRYGARRALFFETVELDGTEPEIVFSARAGAAQVSAPSAKKITAPKAAVSRKKTPRRTAGTAVGEAGEETIDYVDRGVGLEAAIGRAALLSAAEEVELAKAIEVGVLAAERLAALKAAGDTDLVLRRDLRMLQRQGEAAKRRMIESNLRLVKKFVSKYPDIPLDYDEKMQEGVFGLIRAVEKFDYTQGYKFSTYAVNWIRESIGSAIKRKGRAVYLPKYVVKEMQHMYASRDRLESRLGRTVTNDELADEIGMTSQRIAELLSYDRSTVSLDAPMGDENGAPFGASLDAAPAPPDIPRPDGAALHDDLVVALGDLDERERRAIVLSFGLLSGIQMEPDEVGRAIGVSEGTVRKFVRTGMGKIRDGGHAAALLRYCGQKEAS
ncbi:sigma-70 family RNA polymerase sigma factor [Candidatus Saccharibacteria bacterium]|nr:sigma-70 family RNA polymerase sigma factor [Candidatus Saccharibacteria bacterium]